MEARVNILKGVDGIDIVPQEGYEIDLEKSDLKNGKILFKKVEKKYPSEFKYSVKRHGEYSNEPLSNKFQTKLCFLDTLLCLRDEYNRIDGFEAGFRFGANNWSITNINNRLDLDNWSTDNKIIHFGKQETAKLFLNNFEEQLEIVKEFL